MTQTKISTPYPPLSSPSPTRQVKWLVSKEKKSIIYPKDTYAELAFPCKCFENWEKKKNSPKLIQHWVTRTWSLQLQLKINTYKIKKKRERKTKQNKTKNNSNGKWSKAYYVVSSNNNKNKNHFPIWSILKLLLWYRWCLKKKRRDWKRVSVYILTW